MKAWRRSFHSLRNSNEPLDPSNIVIGDPLQNLNIQCTFQSPGPDPIWWGVEESINGGAWGIVNVFTGNLRSFDHATAANFGDIIQWRVTGLNSDFIPLTLPGYSNTLLLSSP